MVTDGVPVVPLRAAGGFPAHSKIILPPNRSALINPHVRISPFSHAAFDEPDFVSAHDTAAALEGRLGRKSTLTYSGREALDLILADLGLASGDVVTIITTSGSAYVSRCVTETISTHCGWSMKIEEKTRAVLAIHEWGRACERTAEFINAGIPLIEDCAYAFATRYASGEPVGRRGDYALFSLPKMFSINFGGIAVGLSGDQLDYDLPRQQADYILRMISRELIELDEICDRRKAVVRSLAEAFAELGASSYFCPAEGEMPPVYMFRAEGDEDHLNILRRHFESYGVEASAFYGSPAFYVPAHHRLGAGSRDYIVEVYRRFLAESSS